MSDTETWARRAGTAERAVNRRFGYQLLHLPGLRLATPQHPRDWQLYMNWMPWWQAHYLDCLIDAQHRESLRGQPVNLGQAEAVLRGYWVRNVFHFSNKFYDDMAWLALALQRANRFSQRYRSRPFIGARCAHRSLRAQFLSAWSSELGGGIYWSKKRDYKNTAANAPVALYFARMGDTQRAHYILDWLNMNLWDERRQVYVDGIHIDSNHVERDEAVWSYNQGPVLDALLTVGAQSYLTRASSLMTGIEKVFTHGQSLILHGDGDGGLFTGILVRYLVRAAAQPTLSPVDRGRARDLVLNTAEEIWTLRAEREGGEIFTEDLNRSAEEVFPPERPIGLSSQLQAWMIFEAAFRLSNRAPH